MQRVRAHGRSQGGVVDTGKAQQCPHACNERKRPHPRANKSPSDRFHCTVAASPLWVFERRNDCLWCRAHGEPRVAGPAP